MIKSPPSNVGDESLIPDLETNIPYALEQLSLSKTQHSHKGGKRNECEALIASPPHTSQRLCCHLSSLDLRAKSSCGPGLFSSFSSNISFILIIFIFVEV